MILKSNNLSFAVLLANLLFLTRYISYSRFIFLENHLCSVSLSLDFNGMVSRLVDMTNTNMDSLRVESHSWTEQFRNAMNVNGGQLEGATHMDYVMHFCTFAWKVISFADIS